MFTCKFLPEVLGLSILEPYLVLPHRSDVDLRVAPPCAPPPPCRVQLPSMRSPQQDSTCSGNVQGSTENDQVGGKGVPVEDLQLAGEESEKRTIYYYSCSTSALYTSRINYCYATGRHPCNALRSVILCGIDSCCAW